jgi:hypothetical protein
LREFQGESLDSGADDLFEAQMLGLKQRFKKVVGLFIILKPSVILLFIHGAV